MTAREIIITLHNNYNGNWDDIYSAISMKKDIATPNLTGADNLITIVDEDYPEDLKYVYKPPFVITKDEVNLKDYTVSITYNIKAHNLDHANSLVKNFDIDFYNIKSIGKVTLA